MCRVGIEQIAVQGYFNRQHVPLAQRQDLGIDRRIAVLVHPFYNVLEGKTDEVLSPHDDGMGGPVAEALSVRSSTDANSSQYPRTRNRFYEVESSPQRIIGSPGRASRRITQSFITFLPGV